MYSSLTLWLDPCVTVLFIILKVLIEPILFMGNGEIIDYLSRLLQHVHTLSGSYLGGGGGGGGPGYGSPPTNHFKASKKFYFNNKKDT